MNCIFCKQISDNSKSIEHILPESLGNKQHILRKGIVCDNCNKYFAIKIEKVVLEKPYFKNVRHRNFITTKKDRLVPDKTLFPYKTGGWFDMWLDEKGFIFDPKDSHIIDQIKNGTFNKLIIPIIEHPEEKDHEVSRLLAKVALEFLTYRIIHDDEWVQEIIHYPQLDPIRNYARYGTGGYWEYHQRRIYSEGDRFVDPINHPEPYEILHEFDILYTDDMVMYFVMVIMGIEYVINLAGSETDYYKKWLVDNNNISPIKRNTERMLVDKKASR